MPVTLPPFLPPTRSGRTFFIAAALLGAVAGLQLAALGVHLVMAAGRPAQAPSVAKAAPLPSPAAAAASPAPAVSPALALASPEAEPASALPTIARPTPAITERNPANPNDLLEQARALRHSGDTNSALARLRDAQAIAPENPMIVAETALTYEAMGLNERSFEQWQRLYDMGDSIGALYYKADSRIHRGPATAAGAPTTAAQRPAEGGEEFQESALLKIVSLTLEEVNDPDAEKKLALKIAVKSRPGFMVDPRRVNIITRFYDRLDGKDIVLTNAVTGYAWLSAPVNWANEETEVLATTYVRPKIDPAAAAASTPEPSPTPAPTPTPKPRRGRKPAAPAPAPQPTPPPAPTPAPVRTYLGYSVCLYYNGQLQDQQAAPVTLLQQFPPPLTLTAE